MMTATIRMLPRIPGTVIAKVCITCAGVVHEVYKNVMNLHCERIYSRCPHAGDPGRLARSD